MLRINDVICCLMAPLVEYVDFWMLQFSPEIEFPISYLGEVVSTR